jgi:hypothetical protein
MLLQQRNATGHHETADADDAKGRELPGELADIDAGCTGRGSTPSRVLKAPNDRLVAG